MPKLTLGIKGIARNFGSGLRDWSTLLGTLFWKILGCGIRNLQTFFFVESGIQLKRIRNPIKMIRIRNPEKPTARKKRATCYGTLLQNASKSHVAHFEVQTYLPELSTQLIVSFLYLALSISIPYKILSEVSTMNAIKDNIINIFLHFNSRFFWIQSHCVCFFTCYSRFIAW